MWKASNARGVVSAENTDNRPMTAKTKCVIVLALWLMAAQASCNLKYFIGHRTTPTLPPIVLTEPPATFTPIPTAIPTLTPIPTVTNP